MFNYRSFLLDAIISANYDAVERNYINKNMQKIYPIFERVYWSAERWFYYNTVVNKTALSVSINLAHFSILLFSLVFFSQWMTYS